ncbi:hypothetical protein SUGI_1036760 [Cryptomeria japonica]|nr:hypothetical protein SUGI_1036760 [Cryptomeria japonica]
MNRSLSFGSRLELNFRPDVTALRRWVVGFCIIRFDLEQGQVIEECYPSGALSPEEELDVAFSSFPDSMSQSHNRSSIHDCMFFFRVRRRGTISTATRSARLRKSVSTGRGGIDEINSSSDVPGLIREEEEGPPQNVASKEEAERTSNSSENSLGELDCKTSFVGSGNNSAVQADGTLDTDSGAGWPKFYVPKILAGVLSPRFREEVVSEKTHLGSPQSNISKLGPSLSIEQSNADLCVNESPKSIVRTSSRGVPGSGGPEYLYGYVFNRQRQDEKLKRGGEQKSVVILSHRPYLSLFKPLLQILAPLYFDVGKRALEHVATYVSRWPRPVPGKFMELPIGNATLKVHLPPAHTLPSGCGISEDEFTSAMAPVGPLNQSIPQGIFHEADIFGIFRGILLQLWVLWELLLIGEALLVIAPTPSQCCEAVAGLVGLVAPLPCNIDFRPYFTIHDPDFSLLNSPKEGEQAPPMILGVTNLFFLKALRNLPHVVSVGSSLSNANRLCLVPKPSNENNGNRGRAQLQVSPLGRFSPANLLKVVKVRRDGPLSLMSEHKEAVWTKYVATTKPDTSILNRLVDAGMSPRIEESMSVVNNEILRRHFLEFTTNFLAPFGPFLRATTPAEGVSPFLDPPPLTPFDAHEFLEGLAARGPGKFLSKRMRANWLDLYRRFLKGPNFMPWFQRRRSVAEQEQHRIWRQARAKADVRQFLSNMCEVEVIDSFNAVERHLMAEIQLQRMGTGTSESSTICQKLKDWSSFRPCSS